MTNNQNRNTSVAVRYGETMLMKQDGGIQFHSVADVLDYSQLLSEAGMLPKGMTAKQATVSIIAGASLGMNPFASVQNICSVNGRPTVWGDMMVALVKSSGLVEDEKTEYFPNPKPSECKGVRYTIKRKNIPTPYVGTFSIEDAKTANLWGKQGPWTTNPARMMLNRARAFALRDGFADVLKGIRQTEEEQDIERTERYRADAERRATTPAPAIREVSPVAVSESPFGDLDTTEEDAPAPAVEPNEAAPEKETLFA